jgi:hypothetical protein
MRLRAGLVALNLAAVLSLWSTSALAASITLAPWGDDPAHAIVAVEGDLVSGDEIQFRTQVGRLTKGIVAFDSDGGNLLAGITIGKTIRLKSFSTAVLDGKRCASACALAWLGGSRRFMSSTAHIGFHAAYITKDGLPSETGAGNALVGSYLTQIGLSEEAVFYITKAAPTEMTLLTLRDAEKIGIEVSPFEQQTPATTKIAPRVAPRETPNQEMTSRARLFVKELYSRYSRTNALGWLGPLYADEVIYEGKLISRREIITKRGLFAEQWPERSFSIPDKSMNAVCGEVPVDCIVTGTIASSVRSLERNVAGSGVHDFTYVLRSSENTFIIKEENTVPRGPPTYTPAK